MAFFAYHVRMPAKKMCLLVGVSQKVLEFNDLRF